MDRSDKRNNKRHSGKKIPRIPIKTYKWEEIRRSRKRGGYPWTYLYKEDFNDLIDPKDFTMDGLRKGKTSSASSASDSLEIKEITEDDVKCLKDIDSSYVVIEGPILLGGQIDESGKEPEGMIESAESSDNISQYLDKEDRGPQQHMESTETLTMAGSSTPQIQVEGRTIERAKSEEPKRKRKLSIESNYSRLSLSKLGFMKRLKDAREIIKFPKLGGSEKVGKKENPKPGETQSKYAKGWEPKPLKSDKPVYIHIPLRPPEGETDEFSYLEFGDKKIKEGPPEVQIEITEDIEHVNEEDIRNDTLTNENNTSSNDNLGLTVANDQEDDVSAIIFLEGDEEAENKGDYDIMVVDIDENSQEMTMSQVTNTEVRRQVLESIKRVESQAELEGGNLSRTSSKTSRSSVHKRRAKSAEPEKKRKSSIDSSYSRKSLSRIGLLKKIKGIYLPFRKSQSRKSVNDINTTKKEEISIEAASSSKKSTFGKDDKPIYIHIPLKPPPGQTDEFSHLEFGTSPLPEPVNESMETNPEEKSPIESPETSKTPQFIFLTPPSDDEILDRPDIPETPSSETVSIFNFGELKQLAKKAVDQVQGTLDSVVEEPDAGDINQTVYEAPVKEDTKDDILTDDNMTIDEEDGLKSTQRLNEENKSVLKSNLRGEASPLPKKKVSFKRRKSSQVTKDDGYEDIENPSEESASRKISEKDESCWKDTSILSTTAFVKANEEKIVLDSEQTITSVTLQEDHNKWSKMSDHEYEPVNPPPDDKPKVSPQKSHVSEVLNPSSTSLLNQSEDGIHLDSSIQGAPAEIENITSPSGKSLTKRFSRSRSKEKEPEKPGKIQTAIKETATKFKTKLHGIKKPNISLPSRPKFQRPNIKTPKITLPKLPDISATFRRASKAEDKKVEVETRSIDEPGQKSHGVFDFSTYPRLFKKKKIHFDSGSLREKIESQHKTEEKVPQSFHLEGSSSRTHSIRIPLHSEESMDQDNAVFQEEQKEFEDVAHPPLYQDDTDANEEEIRQQERQEKHRAAVAAAETPGESRWDHGTYFEQTNDIDQDYDEEPEIIQTYGKEDRHTEIITDLDQPEETARPLAPNRQRSKLQQHDSIDTTHSREVGSSISSLGHTRGVIEEIDSDQFFLREKGISQDNIDMGRYLSTEIREAFRSPINALADMRSYNYEELRASNQSLPDTKKKQVKKPKRKKTPHASQERLRYDQESENEDYNFMPPIRPRRRSKRKKKHVLSSAIIPHTEIISDNQVKPENYEQEVEFYPYYENNQMKGREFPNINVSEPYKDNLRVHESMHRRASEPIPAAPPRKHKSLKSLNASEHESIFDEYDRDHENNNINRCRDSPLIKHQEDSQFGEEFENRTFPPKPPTRSRSKTRSMSRATSHGDSILDRTDSIMCEEEARVPVVEEPCVKDLRDAMGYAIVDKNQNKNWEHKFCTVPRSKNSSSAPPERPLRNYSTLGPSRPPRKLSRNMTDEEKENIDISQYIEIEDERDLQSGEVIQKIQNRPLPAPPRPPRAKSRPLNDITSLSNGQICDTPNNVQTSDNHPTQPLDEMEVSTQTEPLPADFICEEVQQEDTDKIMTPSALRKNGFSETTGPPMDDVNLKRVLITPTKYTYQEETITHGQLLVEPLNGATILPDSELNRERIIPITSDEEETSEIPESFNQLSAPQNEDTLTQKPQKPPRKQSIPRADSLEILRTQKLQVSDLDVERLNVNELVANKIVVSSIDSENLVSHEINSKSGNLKLGNLELEPVVLRKLLEQLQQCSKQQSSILDNVSETSLTEREKTVIDTNNQISTTAESTIEVESLREKFAQGTELLEDENFQEQRYNAEEEASEHSEIPGVIGGSLLETNPEHKSSISSDEQIEPPIRPPRNIEKKINGCEVDPQESAQDSAELVVSRFEGSTADNIEVRLVEGSEIFQSQLMIEPEVDDEPPPRPPQPQVPYIPSQPPSSFYALRAQHYVDGTPEDIPHIHRRKRHHRPQTMSRSSSSESNGMPVPRRRIRSPELSIPQLAGHLLAACSVAAKNSMKNLIDQLNNQIASTSSQDPEIKKQNIQVIIVILLVLIAGLLLLGYGDGRTVHLHHWEYFNPPTDV